jgi:hypothetical protein
VGGQGGFWGVSRTMRTTQKRVARRMMCDSGLCLMLRPAADVYILVRGRAGWWEGASREQLHWLAVCQSIGQAFYCISYAAFVFTPSSWADNMGTTGIRQASRQANEGTRRQTGREGINQAEDRGILSAGKKHKRKFFYSVSFKEPRLLIFVGCW